jgi:Tfp pilus assembly ATPase PilU
MMAYAESGQGVVIMINANKNSRAVNRIVDAVRRDGTGGSAARSAA